MLQTGLLDGIWSHTWSCLRKLEDGDIVNVDVTVYYKGVHGKLFVPCYPFMCHCFYFPYFVIISYLFTGQVIWMRLSLLVMLMMNPNALCSVHTSAWTKQSPLVGFCFLLSDFMVVMLKFMSSGYSVFLLLGPWNFDNLIF